MSPTPATAPESEKNDTLWSANDFGLLGANEHLTVTGHVGGFADVYDGFEFSVASACSVQFSLTAVAPGADLDVALVDPENGQILWDFQSPFDPEVGQFEVYGSWPLPQAFQLVVKSFGGPSSYALHVDATPIWGATLAPGGGTEVAGVDGLAKSSSPGAPTRAPRLGIQVSAASTDVNAPERVEAFRDYLAPAAEVRLDEPAFTRGLLLEYDDEGELVGVAEALWVDGVLLAEPSRDPLTGALLTPSADADSE